MFVTFFSFTGNNNYQALFDLPVFSPIFCFFDNLMFLDLCVYFLGGEKIKIDWLIEHCMDGH